MPDRPADFDWLYGNSADGRGSRDGSDEFADADSGEDRTRVLPTMSRPGEPEPRRRPSGGEAPPSPPVAVDDGPGFRPPRRRRRWGRVLLVVVVLWLVFLIAMPLWAWSRIEKIQAFPSGERPAAQPGTTYLLVGSDSRKGLSKAENRKLGTGGVAVDGGRTDTILMLHTGSGPSVLVSIPRDSLVEIPDHGTTKINAAYAYGGPELLVQTVEQATGVRIDDYVEVGLGGFVNAVDAVGGVTICPKRKIDDPRANLHVKKGCQKADGATALAWSRSRHAFKYGDIARAENQRSVINGIGSGVKSPWTFLNPLRYYRINDAAATSVRISKGTGPIALANFAWAMSRVNGTAGMTCGMPISDLAVHWDSKRAPELMRYLATDNTDDIPKSLCTKTGLSR